VFVILKGKIINLKFLCFVTSVFMFVLGFAFVILGAHDGARPTRLDRVGLGVLKNPFIKPSGFR